MNLNNPIVNPDKFRENVREKILAFFSKPSYSENLERGIYNWALKEAKNRKVVKQWSNPYFTRIYLDHLRSIYHNLKQNTHLIELVETKKIKSHEIAFMSHQELDPERWAELIRLKSIRDKNKYEQNLEAITDSFTCRKCRSKKCTYYELQTRSADEPMTIFITCLDCGSKWKQ
jgi:transcription elongation factor S-II